MLQQSKRTYSPEEYLAREEAAEYKSEYDNGKIVALAGASSDHNLIVGNMITALNIALKAKPCCVYPSDLRLFIERSQLFTYPDVMVVCGKPQFVQDRTDTITNPIVIVEVLSPSTREHDRVKKFARYKQLNSLREYILADSESVSITRLARLEDRGQWIIEVYDELDQVLPLPSVSCEIPLRDIYDKVEFEDEFAGGA